MRNQVAFFLLLFASSIALAQNNKQYLLEYYASTEAELQKDIARLNETQMAFKATPESWSVSQCLEHIILTEKMLYDRIQAGLAAPSNIEEMGAPTHTDEKIVEMVTDRSTKFKAPAELAPEGKYTSPEAAMEELKAGRAAILELLNNTPDTTLRDHVSESPAGIVDAYQNFLFLAGHTARHTSQLQEVKTNPAFPKS